MRKFFKGLLVFLAVLVLGAIFIWNRGGTSDFDEIMLAEQKIGMELDSQMVDVGDVTLHVVFAGPKDGEPVILIHGFPEFWYMWRDHIKVLADAGYRVAAPDMRGYNRSDKPKGRTAYSFSVYANDVTALMDTQDWDTANIVGHDIGARVSWELVFEHAPRVKSAAIFSVGHPLAFAASTEKPGTSWYRTFFKMPVLPELLSRSAGPNLTAKNMTKSSLPGTFSVEDLYVYKAAWDREHAMTSMFGIYRNGFNDAPAMPKDGRPAMPVLFVYGTDDAFISIDISEGTKAYIGDDNVIRYHGLTHWILQEKPEETAADIIEFLDKTSAQP